jgi:hypothetical protein
MKKLKTLFRNIRFLMNHDLSIKPEEKRRVPFSEIRHKPTRADRERIKAEEGK